MKTSLGLCLTLMVFLSSDWIIQGTGALNCYQGIKSRCKGGKCKLQGEGCLVLLDKCTDNVNETTSRDQVIKTPECVTLVLTGKTDDLDWTIKKYDCVEKGSCKAAEGTFKKDQEEVEKEMKERVGKPIEFKIKCEACEKDGCNGAPKSAQGLGLFMMTAALATVIIHGM